MISLHLIKENVFQPKINKFSVNDLTIRSIYGITLTNEVIIKANTSNLLIKSEYITFNVQTYSSVLIIYLISNLTLQPNVVCMCLKEQFVKLIFSSSKPTSPSLFFSYKIGTSSSVFIFI